MKTNSGRTIRAALAVAGLAVTSLFLTACGDDTGDANAEPGEPTTATGSPSPTGSPSEAPAPLIGVIWVEDGTIHTPQGDIPYAGDAAEAARYDDGVLVHDVGRDHEYLVQLDADGNTVQEIRGGENGMATSTDGRYVLFEAKGELRLHDNDTGQTDVVHEADGSYAQPVGVSREVFEGSGDEHVVAYYNLTTNTASGSTTGWAVWDEVNGETRRPADSPAYSGGNLAEPLVYTAIGPHGMRASYTKIHDDSTCSLLQGPHGNELATTCDFTYDAFSPNGDYVLAGPAYRDGFGDGQLAILRADGGEPMVEYQRKNGTDEFYVGSRWEDADHVIVVTFTPAGADSMRGSWAIERFGVDGSREVVVPAVAVAEDADYPFHLG